MILLGQEKEKLRQYVLSAGFHRVGFTNSEVLEKDRAYLEKRGPGPFEPTDLPPRTEPELLLTGARSVIAVALSYHHPDPERPSGARGRLSKYCRGLDYHELMLERLENVAQHIETNHQLESRCYVDTGPPLERAFAEKAGLGRNGKNTNLIISGLGSWVFLGVLVTQLEIEPDPVPDYSICGRCRLCLDACPTQCLTEWELDSERCLGYLNQETGTMAKEYREKMDDWLFGCDICQDVCPHNIKFDSQLVPEFAPLEQPGAFPDLRSMVTMTELDFRTWFAPTAADWRGPQTIRRNAYVALGNSQNEDAVDVLLECFPEDVMLKEHASWAAQALSQRFPKRAEELKRLS